MENTSDNPKHDFAIGDSVINIMAPHTGNPEAYGIIVDIDGLNIKVDYASGKTRWVHCATIRKMSSE